DRHPRAAAGETRPDGRARPRRLGPAARRGAGTPRLARDPGGPPRGPLHDRDQSVAARQVARPDRRTDAGRRDPGPPRAPRPPDRAQRPVAQEGAGCGLKQPTHVAALRSFTFGIGNADGAGRNCSRCPEWVFTIAGIRRLIRSDEPELTLPPIVLRLGVVLLLLAAVV